MSKSLTLNERLSAPVPGAKKSSRAASAPISNMPPVIPPPHRHSAVRLPAIAVVMRWLLYQGGVQRARDLVDPRGLDEQGQPERRGVPTGHRPRRDERRAQGRRLAH